MGRAGTENSRQGIVKRITGNHRLGANMVGTIQSGSGSLLQFETALAVAPGDMVDYTIIEGMSTAKVTKVYPRGGKR